MGFPVLLHLPVLFFHIYPYEFNLFEPCTFFLLFLLASHLSKQLIICPSHALAVPHQGISLYLYFQGQLPSTPTILALREGVIVL